jgi:hypothetical protein
MTSTWVELEHPIAPVPWAIRSVGARFAAAFVPASSGVANTAAFMASDQASAMTATVANISSGSVVD